LKKNYHYDETDSTNNEAKRLIGVARSCADSCGSECVRRLYGAVVTARKQSAGRGRLGKSFESPGGDSVYATFIFEPPEDPADQRITVFAAVAVCRALEQTTTYRPSIKGINDILIEGKKVCGILAESVPGAAILGIGVNINLSEEDFSEELREIAGSLSMDAETRERFFETLKDEVFRCMAIAVHPDAPEASALAAEYHKRQKQ